jgi:hypothetical protein
MHIGTYQAKASIALMILNTSIYITAGKYMDTTGTKIKCKTSDNSVVPNLMFP